MTAASSLFSRRPAAIGEFAETDGLCGRHGGGRAPATFLSRGDVPWLGALGTVALASSSSRPRGPSGRGPQLGGVRIYRRTTSEPDRDRRVIAMASSLLGATATERRQPVAPARR